jgi:hypothetical protein
MHTALEMQGRRSKNIYIFANPLTLSPHCNTRLAWQMDLAWVQDALHSEDTALHDDEVEEKGEDEKLKELGLEQLADEADPET